MDGQNEPLLLRQGDGGVVCLTLNRPKAFNSLSRELLAAVETELDRQGRIVLPPPLLAHAKLEREVVVAGVRDHLELWEPATWRKELEEVGGRVEDVADRLADT